MFKPCFIFLALLWDEGENELQTMFFYFGMEVILFGIIWVVPISMSIHLYTCFRKGNHFNL